MHRVEWTDEKISSFWDNNSELINSGIKYDDYFAKMLGNELLRQVDFLVKFKDKCVLDYGCGQGDLIELLAGRYNPRCISGVDVSKESIDIVNKRMVGNEKFEEAVEISNIHTIRRKYDIVLCTEVVEHLIDEELEELFQNIKYVLNKNGLVVFTTPNKEDLSKSIVVCPDCGCYFHKVQHIRIWDKISLSSFARKHGLEEIGCKEINLRNFDNFIYRFVWWGIDCVNKLRKKERTNLIMICKRVD